ncbi:MAG TPA: putative sugar nucleotidyl transferase [Puia sp.]|nr:putative sugar nucleotidyl transferase [Puia sp.]
MDTIVLKDLPANYLYPFTLTRSVLDIRIGILTIRQKWELLGVPVVAVVDKGEPIPVNMIPSSSVASCIKKGNPDLSGAILIEYPWQIFQFTDEGIRNDFLFLTQNKKSAQLSATNRVISPENIFVEPGAKIEHSILNASAGPIYISKNAEIMEGSMIRGPFFLGEESVVKMGAKIYGATSIGKKCVVGGEIKNSVFFDYSNKAHDGYIGDSVIGSWCNLGAGTCNSNLKNTASDIGVWSQRTKQFINVGSKCGLLMGDYTRSAINSSFNTGTVVGVCCNIFSEGLTSKFIPDFSWGKGDGSRYAFDKAIIDIANWKRLKNEALTDMEIQNLRHIFENS